MPLRPLESLGAMVREKRGQKKLREFAREIGISPATLMRVEAGRIPDLATFGRICGSLRADPREFLGFERPIDSGSKPEGTDPQIVSFSAHFKADKTPKQETVNALAQMLLLAAKTQPRAGSR